MKLKLEFHKSEDEGFGYNGLFIGIIKDREVWVQTLPTTEWWVGFQQTWYDGPIKMLGFGFFEFIWHRQM